MTAENAVVQRIGVFGGAFDPPHVAHAALVRAALVDLQLDELRVIPTGHAWHKSRTLTPAHHRLAMAELAFSQIPRVKVDPIETQRAGPSYTVDTLRAFKTQLPAADFFLIVGEDQALALTRWHEWQAIFQLAIICVAVREDLTGTKPPFTPTKSYESRFRRLQMPVMPVSATDIRARIATHQCVSSLVFEHVARYIDDHHLYQTT